MDLQTFTNGNQAVKRTTTLASVYCIVITIAFIIAYYLQIREIEQITQKMIVIDTKGQVYNSNTINNSETRIYEYKNHVKMFYSYWYSFDENNYPAHIESGLHLIGDRGKELLNEYKGRQVEKELIDKNLKFEVQITNVVIDMTTSPVSGKIEGIQTGKRARGVISRKLSATFTLDDVSRSDENIHGCKIITWEIYESSVINETNNNE